MHICVAICHLSVMAGLTKHWWDRGVLWIFLRKHKNIFYIFCHLLTLRWHTYLKSILVEDKDPFILHGQCYVWGCLGHARSQGINNYGIDLVVWEYSNFSTTRVNTLRPRQNGRNFPDDIFNCIFLNENVWISNKISLKFVGKGQINNIPALVQIMDWRRPGDKPLSEPMMISLLTYMRHSASMG